MTDSQDPKSCEHGNVTTTAGEFEHYDRLGPGCWHPVKGGQCRSWQALIEHVQSVAAARAEARVRAELADEADRRAKTHVVEGCDWYARDALLEFAEDIRAGRLVAGSSPDTTPDAKDHEMEGGSIAVSGSNLQSPDTTPEPKRRYPRTSELTDQDRYEIEEASAATWADPADREDS